MHGLYGTARATVNHAIPHALRHSGAAAPFPYGPGRRLVFRNSTPYGFHVIKLVEKKAGRKVPFDEVKDDVAGFLKEQKAGTIAKDYVAGLRKKAKVQIFI